MAEGDTPFDVEQRREEPPVAGRGDFENIRNQWTSFLDQPGARAMLLQTGIALMQPPAFGDTPASQIGRAIGAGAAAMTRGEEQESKIQLTESRAREAQARAGEAGSKLTIEQMRQRGMTERQQEQNELRAYRAYQQDLKDVNAAYDRRMKTWEAAERNAKLMGEKNPVPHPGTPPPFMDFETWRRVRGPALIPRTYVPEQRTPQAVEQEKPKEEGE